MLEYFCQWKFHQMIKIDFNSFSIAPSLLHLIEWLIFKNQIKIRFSACLKLKNKFIILFFFIFLFVENSKSHLEHFKEKQFSKHCLNARWFFQVKRF